MGVEQTGDFWMEDFLLDFNALFCYSSEWFKENRPKTAGAERRNA